MEKASGMIVVVVMTVIVTQIIGWWALLLAAIPLVLAGYQQTRSKTTS